MAAGLNPQLAPCAEFGPAIATGGGHLGQGGQGIEVGHQPGGAADRAGLQAHPAAQGREQVVLPLGRPGPQLQDAPLPSLEGRRDEALFVGQGLAADPMLGHGAGPGPAHRQEIAEAAVVLETQVGVAAGLAFQGFLFGQPPILVVELIAQAIQHRIDAVVDQAAFAEAQRRRRHQLMTQFRSQVGQLRPGLSQGLQRLALGIAQQGGQPRQPFEAVGEGHQIAGGGAAGAGSAGQSLQIAHRPQQPAQGQPLGAMGHQLAHRLLADQDRGQVHQRRFDPAPQAAAAHGGGGAIQGPEQGAMQRAAQLGAGQFQVAAGLGIEHQLIAGLPDGGHVQGDRRPVLVAGLGGIEIGQQPAGGSHRQGHFAQPQASEAGEAKALQQAAPGLGAFKGGAQHGGEPPAVGAPGGSGVPRLAWAGPDHLGGLHLQQLLVQGGAALPFGDSELAGADIGHGHPPAAAARLEHHGAEPVVAAGGQHPLLEHGAGGEHAGDVAAQQGPFGGGGFQLVAEGDAEAAAHQFGAVALGGMVGNARHRHPADRLAGLLAGEGELQQARQQDRVFEEELEEIAEAVEQHPLRMGRLELDVVAQHRRQGGRIDQAVVVPAGQVGIQLAPLRPWRVGGSRSSGVACDCVVGFSRLAGVSGGNVGGVALARPRPGGGIGAQPLVIEAAVAVSFAVAWVRRPGIWGWCRCHQPQIGNQGELLRGRRGLGRRARHHDTGDGASHLKGHHWWCLRCCRPGRWPR